MPRRRPPRVFPERVTSAIESMTPGTLGGRVSSAAPVMSDAVAATVGGNAGVVDQASGATFYRDRYDLASDGAQTVDLTYLPVEFSEHVYLNGIEQDEGTDWTRTDQTISIDAAMGALTADVLDVRYAYRFGAPVVLPNLVAATIWHTDYVGADTFDFGDSLTETDFCLVATIGTGSMSGRGTWTKIATHSYQSRTVEIWLGYDFDNTGTDVTYTADGAGAISAYGISTENVQSSAPAYTLGGWSDVFGGDVNTSSVTPAVGDIVFAVGGGPSAPTNYVGRTDTGTTLTDEIIEGHSGNLLLTAWAVATTAVSSSTSWETTATSLGHTANIVKVTP